MIRLGLWFYDYLSKRKILRGSQKINFNDDPRRGPLKDRFKQGFGYLDCQTDDARLVVANALQARHFGADILTRTEVLKIVDTPLGWQVTAFDKTHQQNLVFVARAVVNASGAWVSQLLTQTLGVQASRPMTWVKGSHFVVPRLYSGKQAYILQNKDQRIIFVIPYQQDYTLIGTTDVVYTGDPNQVEISEEEIDYLLQAVNFYFKSAVTKKQIIWSYAGIRSLFGDSSDAASKMTREYFLEVNESSHQFPMISIFGGKLTTYRLLAEQVLKKLERYFPNLSGAWTAGVLLPGGDLLGFSFEEFIEQLKRQYPVLPFELLHRYAKNYGSLALKFLSPVTCLADMGHELLPGFYEVEAAYLLKEEWAMTVEDLLFRRTKCGIAATQVQKDSVNAFITLSFKNLTL